MVLRQPWAQAVVEGAFPALVRSVPTNIREQVGVLAASNPDPAGYRAEDEDLPRRAVVGAVEIVDCVEVEGDVRAFLADHFGRELAEFYPEHFIPDEGTKHVWILGEAVAAETVREWKGDVPRTWGRCSTWIEGERIPLLRPAVKSP